MTQGLVTFLYARQSDSLYYVEINVAPSGRPACATGTTYYIIRTESSDVGKITEFASPCVRFCGALSAGPCFEVGDPGCGHHGAAAVRESD